MLQALRERSLLSYVRMHSYLLNEVFSNLVNRSYLLLQALRERSLLSYVRMYSYLLNEVFSNLVNRSYLLLPISYMTISKSSSLQSLSCLSIRAFMISSANRIAPL